jgi:succinate-semialdehyde dehydrogenase/glutarate-semialdehyde dehydrogenase
MKRTDQVTTVDPSTGGLLSRYAETTADEIDAILDQAAIAARAWAATSIAQRCTRLRQLATALRRERARLALLATTEMGKPLTESVAEIDKCAAACDWFADHAPAMLEPAVVDTEALRSEVAYVPLGVLFAIMPWNFPYWQVVRALAPALAAGNAVILKHAPSTTGCALALRDLAREAGLPHGLLSVVVAGVDRTPTVSERIISDDRVAAITLTGSTSAGRAVAAIAGRALKKTVLELGGSDPFIVLEDANIEAAAKWAVRSRFQNAGQSCIAAKRIIVEDTIAEAFTERFVEAVGSLTLGNPTNPAVTIGPLARADLRDAVARQVDASVRQGAKLRAGGKAVDGPGYFYEPTVLDRVTSDMPVMSEEVFGPAVPIVTATGLDDAITMANATKFGLGSSIWTADIEQGRFLATRIHAGLTAINGMVASDVRLPFGGVKDSGYGRELAAYGIREFVNIHAIVIEPPAGPSVVRTAAE